MQPKLSWELFSNSDRNQIIDLIKQSISNNEGCIINFNMFSDLALSLSIEIEEKHIPALYSELSLFVNLSEIGFHQFSSESSKEWLLFMNISFGKGKGYLKNEVPEVPG